MSSESATNIYRALSIAQTRIKNAAPVLYELTGASTEIGAADDNAIVLTDSSIALHHLTVRRANGRDYLLIDLADRWRHRDRTWCKFRPGDAYWCPRHGSFERLDHRAWCPRCKHRRGSLWLMRPLSPGDTFDIGTAFRAKYVIQEHATQPSPADYEPRHAFPTPEMFEAKTLVPKIALSADAPEIPTRALPTDDSNLWRWQPEGVPFPIFLHQRVNITIAQHARQNSEREVGGILLGEVRQDERGQMYIIVTHAIKAEFASETRGHLTFTHKTWLQIRSTYEAHYPDKVIVGWYHTHPG